MLLWLAWRSRKTVMTEPAMQAAAKKLGFIDKGVANICMAKA